MLDAALVFLYAAFVTWLSLATYLNLILLPVKAIVRNKTYNIGRVAALAYITLWGLVFTLPVLKAALLGE